MTRPRLPLGTLLAAVACLAAATPPGWFPVAGLLVLPGLALQFALALGDRRPLLLGWLLGALHTGAFSWSLHHVAWLAWLLVALCGGLYTLLVAAAVRAAPRRLAAAAFAVAVAGAAWLRAEAPEIPYPHGQPCHSLWQMPWLLGPVRLGGEPLANALLAALAVLGLRAARAQRAGGPGARRRAWRLLLAGLAAWAVLAASAPLLRVPKGPPPATVDVAAVEPGVHPNDPFAAATREEQVEIVQRRFRERLFEPTAAVAGPGAAAPPDLVLWPESSSPWPAEVLADGSVDFSWFEPVLRLSPGTRLCLGADLLREDGRPTPAALLLDARGALLGHHEKQRLVPGGERIPFLRILPEALAGRIRAGMRAALGYVPDLAPGRDRPLLATAAGVPFAALLCYDNAFPSTFAQAARDGARFVAVLSNEAWYRGGAELDQLAAITVVRALAAQLPVVRCTSDGHTMAVDRDGRILARLPPVPAEAPEARVLRLELPLGAGRLPPLTAVHPWLGWAAVAVLSALVLQGLARWARLRSLARSTAGGVGAVPRSGTPPGGS